MNTISALTQISPTLTKSVMIILGFGITTFVMLLMGNIYRKKKSTGAGKISAQKAVFNATLVLAIMIGLYAIINMADVIFAETSVNAGGLPF
jgi:hypothetical protein